METTQSPRLREIPGLLLGLIDRPSDTFRRISRGARWVWIVPATLLLVSQLLYTAVTAEPSRQLSREITRYTLEHGRFASQMTPAQRQEAIAQAEAQTSQTGPLLAAIGVGGGVVVTMLGWVVTGVAFHALAALLGSQSTTIGAMVATTSWAWLPFWLKQLVQILFVIRSGQLPRHEGLGFLVSAGNRVLDSFNPLYVFLSQLDLWQIANWILLILGVSAVSGFTRTKSALIVLPLWLVLSLIALAPVILSKTMMGF